MINLSEPTNDSYEKFTDFDHQVEFNDEYSEEQECKKCGSRKHRARYFIRGTDRKELIATKCLNCHFHSHYQIKKVKDILLDEEL